MLVSVARWMAALAIVVSWPTTAIAIPLYARQTSQPCASCHVGFPELTPFGRAFKLGAYTLGQRQDVPLSMMALASVNRIADTGGGAYPKSGRPVVEGGSLFTGGKFTDYLGGFLQWTYNNLVQNPDGTFSGHSSIDNVDLRAARQLRVRDVSLLAGLSMHNYDGAGRNASSNNTTHLYAWVAY